MKDTFHLLNISTSLVYSSVFKVDGEDVDLIANSSYRLPRFSNSNELYLLVREFILSEKKRLKLEDEEVYIILAGEVDFPKERKDGFNITQEKAVLESGYSNYNNNESSQIDRCLAVLLLSKSSSEFTFFESSNGSLTKSFHNEKIFRFSEIINSDEDPFQVIKQLWKEDGGVVTDLDRLLNYDLVPPLGLASEITKFTYLYIYKYIFSALFQNFQSESKLVKEYDVILTGELGGNLGSNDFLIQNLAASTPLTGIYNLYVDKKNILTSISQLEQLLHISIDKAKYLLKFQVISFEDSQKKYSEKDTLCTITINNERQILPYNDIIWGFEWNENEELNITIDFEKGVTIKNLVDGSVSLQQGKGYNGIVIDTTSSLPNDITLFQKWHKDISENFRL